ncbi:hypothetical protein D5F01_LYC24267 [Larimichthys crocea]|uniref:Uncharacterized protein n=1 Tax=Larimichthys crocea TaxID=215358 RepID=A0A6G0HFB4_LARCR|nr:hypothetical protein D5F01_LYC24267 [Larimichthys crocea]
MDEDVSGPGRRNGTGLTGGPSGGRTVHPPSPVGDGRQSPTLIGQCLPQGPPSMPVPDIARTRMLFAKDGLNQPGDGFSTGRRNRGKAEPRMIARMVEVLSDMIKPAAPTRRTADLIVGNAKNWGYNTYLILMEHYETCLEELLEELTGILTPDWKSAFEVAVRWARRNLTRITQDAIDHAEALVTAKQTDAGSTTQAQVPRHTRPRAQGSQRGTRGRILTEDSLLQEESERPEECRVVEDHIHTPTHSELEALFDELQAEEEMEAAVSSPQTQRKVRAEVHRDPLPNMDEDEFVDSPDRFIQPEPQRYGVNNIRPPRKS